MLWATSMTGGRPGSSTCSCRNATLWLICSSRLHTCAAAAPTTVGDQITPLLWLLKALEAMNITPRACGGCMALALCAYVGGCEDAGAMMLGYPHADSYVHAFFARNAEVMADPHPSSMMR